VESEKAVHAFAAIREEYHAIPDLSLPQGLAHSKIARHLQMPLGTVKSFRRRGLTKVRGLMHVLLRRSPRSTVLLVGRDCV
jgi:RNA polymerase sigma-70 factor (ECF subfamily)